MAATKRNAMNIEEARKKIQTTQLLNRLQNNGLGKLKQELTTSQVKSIEILLRKSVPDLSSITLQGDAANPIKMVHRIERVIVHPKN